MKAIGFASLLFLFSATTGLAQECSTINGARDRLDCYDKQENLDGDLQQLDVFELLRIENAADVCGLRLDLDAFRHRLMVGNLTWAQLHSVHKNWHYGERWDQDLQQSTDDKDAYCAQALKEYGRSPENEYGAVYLSQKSACSP